MNKMFGHFFSAVLATVAFAVGHAKADFVAWTYNWGRSPVAVQADGTGTGGLSLTDEGTLHAVGSSDIVATNIRSFSSALRTAPDTFTNKAYTLSLFLKDDASGKSTTLTFGGVFNGTLSAVSANITTTFKGLVSQTVKLGDHTYTVTLNAYAPPGPPTASNAGSITGHVAVDEFTPGGSGSHSAPEPSSLLLAGTGLSFLGAAGWKKWKRRGLARELAYA
jgi:hypothetical protein